MDSLLSSGAKIRGGFKAPHKEVVTPSAFPIHRDTNAVAFELRSEGIAGQLTALIGVEEAKRPLAGYRFLHSLHVKLHIHCAGKAPSQHCAAVPINQGTKVHPVFAHTHVNDVHSPDLIGMDHGFASEQIWVDLVLGMASTGAGGSTAPQCACAASGAYMPVRPTQCPWRCSSPLSMQRDKPHVGYPSCA